jgi:hypothetical protein
MRKLALLAVVLMPLVSGCVAATCDVPTVTIDWRLQDLNGVQRSCSYLNVVYVDIYIGTAGGLRYICSDGGAVIDVSRFAPGVYPTTVEGIGADGWPRNRYEFDVTVNDCRNQAYYPVLGEAQLRIDYALPGGVCSANPSYLWFSLIDDATGIPIWWANQQLNATQYDCNNPLVNEILLDVPFGNYTLDWIQEINYSGPGGTAVALQQNCTNQPVAVTGIGITSLPVTLAPPVGLCY